MSDIQGLRASFSGRELRRHLQNKIRDHEEEIRKIEARTPRPNESMTSTGLPRVNYSAVKQSGSPFSGGVTPIEAGRRNGHGTAVVSVQIDHGRIAEHRREIDTFQFWLDNIEAEHTYHLDEGEMQLLGLATPLTRMLNEATARVPQPALRSQVSPVSQFPAAPFSQEFLFDKREADAPPIEDPHFETVQVAKPNFYSIMLLSAPDIAAIVFAMALTPEYAWRWRELPEHWRPSPELINHAHGYLRAGNRREAVELLFPFLPQQRVDAIASELAKLEGVAHAAAPSAFEVETDQPEEDV